MTYVAVSALPISSQVPLISADELADKNKQSSDRFQPFSHSQNLQCFLRKMWQPRTCGVGVVIGIHVLPKQHQENRPRIANAMDEIAQR